MSALALKLGSKLARGAELDIIREELVIDRIGTPLDDDVVCLQHEARDHAVVTASADQECHRSEKHGRDAPTCFVTTANVETPDCANHLNPATEREPSTDAIEVRRPHACR